MRIVIPCMAAAISLPPTMADATAQPLSVEPQDALGRQEVRYPRGSSRPAGEYAVMDGFIDLESIAFSPLAFNAVAGATIDQLGLLPPGFGLRGGAATPVMIAGDAPLDPAFAAFAPAEAPPQAKWFAEYSLDYEGIPVSKHASVLVVTDLEGEIRYLRRRGVPSAVTETVPTISPRDAVLSALDEAGSDFVPDPRRENAPRLEIWVSPEDTGHLAWTFVLAWAETGRADRRRYWVAATETPAILNWESTVYSAFPAPLDRVHGDPSGEWSRPEHSGRINAPVWTASPRHGTSVRPLSWIRVQRDGVPGFGFTNEAGEFHLAGGGGPATVRARPEGPFAVVQNAAGQGLEASGLVDSGGFVELAFSGASEEALAQLSAFHWVNRAYEFSRPVLATLSDRPFADLLVRVNDVLVVGDQAFGCTAMFDESPQHLIFLRAGRGIQDEECPNTAYQDLVFHEYGHAVDYWRGGTQDAGYSEGFGDALAILATRQPCFGRDLLGPGTCRRDATDVDMWPPADGEPGWERGKRYAQFVWELVRELQQLHPDEDAFEIATQLVLAAAAGNPSTIPDAVRLSFIANETNEQPSEKGPYCQALANAAESRGIPNPGCPSNWVP
jgi:hypothetical protein